MIDGAILHVFDPKVTREQATQEFVDHGILPSVSAISPAGSPSASGQMHSMGIEQFNSQFILVDNPKEAVVNAHAIVILTEWDMFKTLPYEEYYSSMAKPPFIFDGRNILNHKQIANIGFQVHAIGKKKFTNKHQ